MKEITSKFEKVLNASSSYRNVNHKPDSAKRNSVIHLRSQCNYRNCIDFSSLIAFNRHKRCS
jgi:hypothetical protein